MWIVNLSAGGLLVDTHAAPVAGEVLECCFELPDCPHHFRLPAHVVRVIERSTPELTTYRVGIEFDEMADSCAASISSCGRKAKARESAPQRARYPPRASKWTRGRRKSLRSRVLTDSTKSSRTT